VRGASKKVGATSWGEKKKPKGAREQAERQKIPKNRVKKTKDEKGRGGPFYKTGQTLEKAAGNKKKSSRGLFQRDRDLSVVKTAEQGGKKNEK